MCSPKTPAPAAPAPAATVEQEPIAAPTYADAEVQKAGANTRQQQAATANRNVRSTALGVTEDAATKKKNLLGE